LGTDQDHAIAYGCSDEDFDAVDPYFGRMAAAVTDGLEACGIPRCRGNVMAENPAWRRTEQGWRRRFGQYITDRDLIAARITGIAFDYRRVSGVLDIEPTLDEVIRSAGTDQAFLGRLASTVLESRPPVGRKRDIVVERGGDHPGKLDLKHGGITIVTNLARFFAIKGGITQNRTLERLASAASLGLIPDRVRDDLEEAFRFLWRLRLTHHVEQVDRGEQVDDFIDPDALSSIARRALPEALHVINDALVALERQMSTHHTGGRPR
jgi:CBS domain-containing protein